MLECDRVLRSALYSVAKFVRVVDNRYWGSIIHTLHAPRLPRIAEKQVTLSEPKKST